MVPSSTSYPTTPSGPSRSSPSPSPLPPSSYSPVRPSQCNKPRRPSPLSSRSNSFVEISVEGRGGEVVEQEGAEEKDHENSDNDITSSPTSPIKTTVPAPRSSSTSPPRLMNTAKPPSPNFPRSARLLPLAVSLSANPSHSQTPLESEEKVKSTTTNGNTNLNGITDNTRIPLISPNAFSHNPKFSFTSTGQLTSPSTTNNTTTKSSFSSNSSNNSNTWLSLASAKRKADSAKAAAGRTKIIVPTRGFKGCFELGLTQAELARSD